MQSLDELVVREAIEMSDLRFLSRAHVNSPIDPFQTNPPLYIIDGNAKTGSCEFMGIAEVSYLN